MFRVIASPAATGQPEKTLSSPCADLRTRAGDSLYFDDSHSVMVASSSRDKTQTRRYSRRRALSARLDLVEAAPKVARHARKPSLLAFGKRRKHAGASVPVIDYPRQKRRRKPVVFGFVARGARGNHILTVKPPPRSSSALEVVYCGLAADHRWVRERLLNLCPGENGNKSGARRLRSSIR